MDHLLQKYSWAIVLLVLVISAYFVARSTTYIADSILLDELADSQNTLKPLRTNKRVKTVAERNTRKSGEPIISRNLFNLAYLPTEETPDTEPDSEPVDLDAPADCTNASVDPSGAELKGTVVATPQEFSNITIEESGSGGHSVYWQGEKAFDDEAIVYEIHARKVFFKRSGTCTYLVLGEENTAKKPTTPKRPSLVSSRKPTMEGITQVSDTSYQIDRELINSKVSNLAALASEGKAIPNMRGGEFNGYKLYAIRSTSLFAQIGLKNGDILQTVNGEKIDSIQKAMGLLNDLNSLSSIEIGVQRRGAPVNFDYTIK